MVSLSESEQQRSRLFRSLWIALSSIFKTHGMGSSYVEGRCYYCEVNVLLPKKVCV